MQPACSTKVSLFFNIVLKSIDAFVISWHEFKILLLDSWQL